MSTCSSTGWSRRSAITSDGEERPARGPHEFGAELAEIEASDVGVGPHPEPWPDDDRLDPDLLAAGDRRNVVDRYRYWRREAIVADLDRTRHRFHVAIENWEHDRNIGAVVRNANAFNAAAVHIVGRRKWNRRGAMVTDRYMHVLHHESAADLAAWAADRSVPVVGIDNLPGAVPLEQTELPETVLMVFGQEGPGLSQTTRDACEAVVSISQFGSTRSINAGVASGIAMWAWALKHAGSTFDSPDLATGLPVPLTCTSDGDRRIQ